MAGTRPGQAKRSGSPDLQSLAPAFNLAWPWSQTLRV